ncbi:MAG TPA: hypothetical protein DCZ40_01115 [Lachnospiraceae bacterium]|nr:hypothetical protein [Lachnospiraceae bacterium]
MEASKQISVYKTKSALLELNNCMRQASKQVPWHIHAQGRQDEGGYSLIRAVMVDYSDSKNSISVYANLSPDIVKYLYEQIKQNKEDFSYFQQKIFHEEGAPPDNGIVTCFSIGRHKYDTEGRERRMPWVAEIQNGKGRIAHNKNGGQFCEKGSYRKEKSVSVSLRDEDIFVLFTRADAVIRAFEQDSLFRKRNAKNFQKLYQMLEALILGN